MLSVECSQLAIVISRDNKISAGCISSCADLLHYSNTTLFRFWYFTLYFSRNSFCCCGSIILSHVSLPFFSSCMAPLFLSRVTRLVNS